MSSNETLGQALENAGDKDQASLCSDAVLALTKDQCASLLEGHEVGLTREDRASFNKLVKTRVNNVQSMLPWSDVKMSDEVDPNW